MGLADVSVTVTVLSFSGAGVWSGFSNTWAILFDCNQVLVPLALSLPFFFPFPNLNCDMSEMFAQNEVLPSGCLFPSLSLKPVVQALLFCTLTTQGAFILLSLLVGWGFFIDSVPLKSDS